MLCWRKKGSGAEELGPVYLTAVTLRMRINSEKNSEYKENQL